MFAFENFPVYKLSEEFFSSIQPLLKNKLVDIALRDQLLRASSSISLNIAEGAGKHSRKEKKYFYAIARGSVQECVSILRLMRIQGNLQEVEFRKHYETLTLISKMLSGLINRMLENK